MVDTNSEAAVRTHWIARLVDIAMPNRLSWIEVCQQKRMVPSTVGMGVETAVESQLSEVGNERDL